MQSPPKVSPVYNIDVVTNEEQTQHSGETFTSFKYSQWFPPFCPNVVAMSVSRDSQSGTNTHT